MREIPVDKAYLIGSWANGKAKKNSDVDLLVMSSAFEKMDFDERLKILYRNSAGIDFDMHIHPTTWEEYANASVLTSLGRMRIDKKISLI